MDQMHREVSRDWSPLPEERKMPESVSGYRITYWQDVFRRFKQNKLAVGAVITIFAIIIMSIIGPYMTGKTYSSQELNLRNMPPVIEITTAPDGTNFYIHPELRLFITDKNGKVIKMIEPSKKMLTEKRYEYTVDGKEYILGFGSKGAYLLTGDRQPITQTRKVWNKNYVLGTDSIGRDMLTRVLYGGRISLIVAFVTSFFTLILGVLYGGISGYYGGNADVLMMRIVDVLNAIPNTIYVILLMVYFGQGIYNILIAMAITSWLGMARLVRGQVLSLKEQEFVLASKSIGVSPIIIVIRHLLPNCIGPIIVSATLSIPGAIATEAFMSFIGLGVAPPMPSWGILSNEGISTILSSPYQVLLPSIAISLTMFAFSFFGDGLRDSLDPKLRK